MEIINKFSSFGGIYITNQRISKMKRILLLGLLIGSFSALFAQVPKMVIIEEFTNASCPPCAAQNPAFNALLDNHLDKVIPIKYQTAFPGFDPYNQQNPGEVNTRLGVYSELTGVPTAAIDGVIPGNNYGGGGLSTWTSGADGYNGGPYGYNAAVINYAASQETPLEINVVSEYNEELTSATITVTMVNHGDTELSSNHRVQVLLLEKENEWRVNPGSTAERDFTYVMRKMYPNANGTLLSAIAPGDTYSFQIEAQIPGYIYDLSEMVFVTFVENVSTRAILNGAIADVVEVPDTFYDVAVDFTTSSAGDELCGKTLNPGVQITNTSAKEIQGLSVYLSINGVETVKEIDEPLMGGESLQIDFEEINLSGGQSVVIYGVRDFVSDSGREINSLNNISDIEQYTSIAEASSKEISLGFESNSSGTNLQNVIGITPNSNIHVVDASYLSASNALGGYGASAKSIWVNFWQWELPALDPNGSLMVGELVDVSAMQDILITFDRAHAQYNSPVTNDRLQARVSYDCGETWTLAYNKAGSQLATAPPAGSFFIPTATQWATDTIIVNNADGNDNLLFKFDLVSDWGNNLYIDNISIEELIETNTLVREPINAEISLAPNPSNGQTQMTVILAEEANMEVYVYNSLGQRVANIGKFNYAIGEYKIDLNLQHLPVGMYQVVLQDGSKLSNQKLMITK